MQNNNKNKRDYPDDTAIKIQTVRILVDKGAYTNAKNIEEHKL